MKTMLKTIFSELVIGNLWHLRVRVLAFFIQLQVVTVFFLAIQRSKKKKQYTNLSFTKVYICVLCAGVISLQNTANHFATRIINALASGKQMKPVETTNQV